MITLFCLLCTHPYTELDGNTTRSTPAAPSDKIIGSFSAVVAVLVTILLVLVIILIVFGVVHHKRMKNGNIGTTENLSYPMNQIQASNTINTNSPTQNVNNNDSELINLPNIPRREPTNISRNELPIPRGEPPKLPRGKPHTAVPRQPIHSRPKVPVKPIKPQTPTHGQVNQINTAQVDEKWHTDKDGYEIIDDQSHDDD